MVTKEKRQELPLKKAVKILFVTVIVLFSFHGEIPASFTCPRSSPKHERYMKTLALLMQAISFTDSFTFDHVFMHNFK